MICMQNNNLVAPLLNSCWKLSPFNTATRETDSEMNISGDSCREHIRSKI